tara:strand:- start:14897 stop:16012 length:1116 start_codon:yes stop_codon:yes gene_type:complete
MAKKNTAATSNWLDNAEEVPRVNTVAAIDRSKRQRFYRRFIIATIVLLPISLVTNVLTFGQIGTGQVEASAQYVANSEAKAAAIIAVEDWLAEEISPLPAGGRLVSWDGADLVVKPVQTDAESKKNPVPDFDIETHHFTVVDGTGVTYSADVAVAIDPATGAHVMSSPSIIPNAPSADGGSVSGSAPWFGLSTATPPNSVTDAVSAWAKVYTGGEPNALRLAVQDDNGDHTYVPLSNVASQSVAITRAAYLPDEGADAGAQPSKTSKMIVQVTLTVQWEGTREPKSGEKLPTITLDLLVSNAGGAAPFVVAWGGPGSGPTLTPQINALTGRTVGTSAEVSTDEGTSDEDTSDSDTPEPAATGGPDSIEGDE